MKSVEEIEQIRKQKREELDLRVNLYKQVVLGYVLKDQ